MDETPSQPEAAAPKPPSPNDPLTEDGILILCRLSERGVDHRALAYGFDISLQWVNKLVKRDSWKIGPARVQQVG